MISDQVSTTPALFTVCALFYGDYPELATRLVDSLSGLAHYGFMQTRVGLNNVCEETDTIVGRLCPEMIVEGKPPYYKYPVMRELFHSMPITTPYVMWFDDDSFVDSSYGCLLFDETAKKLERYDMVGKQAFCRINSSQVRAIQEEPWYTGRKMVPMQPVQFCLGGWWAARTQVIVNSDWPIASLEHRGGDVLMGAMCYQQGYAMASVGHGVAISADENGRTYKAKRRGADQAPWKSK